MIRQALSQEFGLNYIMKSTSPSFILDDPPADLGEEITEKKLQTKHITQNLEATYGIPRNTRPDAPLDELILTILSQSTSDINSRRAFDSLKNFSYRSKASVPRRQHVFFCSPAIAQSSRWIHTYFG
jgi:hypothetical protein